MIGDYGVYRPISVGAAILNQIEHMIVSFRPCPAFRSFTVSEILALSAFLGLSKAVLQPLTIEKYCDMLKKEVKFNSQTLRFRPPS